MAAADLEAMAEEYLAACAEGVVVAGLPPFPIRYVAPSAPALDCCPMLAVHVSGVTFANTAPGMPPLPDTGRRPTVTGTVVLASFTATFVRCIPVIGDGGSVATIPAAAAMQAAATEINADLWAIWNHLLTLKRQEKLFPPIRREMGLSPSVVVDAQGGCAGWMLVCTVQIPGFETVAP